MLFVSVMEALSKMMDRAVSGGPLKGFDVSFIWHGNVTVTHLLFVENTLVFCDAEVSELDNLRRFFCGSRLCQALRLISENVRSHRLEW